MIPFFVLGLVHGQIDLDLEVKFSREKSSVRLGSGISIVLPGEAIYELLMNDPYLSFQRAELLERTEAEKVPLPTPKED